MRIISPLLKHVVYPGLERAGYRHLPKTNAPAIVTYHGILPHGYKVINPALDGNLVSAQSFRSQLRFLKAHYHVISPVEFRLWCEARNELPPRSVLLTCDDGLLNTLTNMLPILQEFSMQCLFFVTGASLGETASMLWHEELYLMLMSAGDSVALWFDENGLTVCANGKREKRRLWWELVRQSSQCDSITRRALLERARPQLNLADNWASSYKDNDAAKRRFLSLNHTQLRELARAGMTIGAHTLSHPILSQLPDETAWSEIYESRHRLEAALGCEIWALAYPFGDPASVSSRDIQMAERAGFTCAFLNVEQAKTAKPNMFALPRVHVTADMKLSEFEAHISGLYSSLRQLFSGTIITRTDELAASTA